MQSKYVHAAVERDTAIRHLRNAERVVYDSAYRAEVEAFLLSMRDDPSAPA